ncbi:MAG: tetratricopeptide repeat protein [Myxococcaceae bacterium]|nr:tetratricopeptide repeat protein [Myxococcaceae bacterium]
MPLFSVLAATVLSADPVSVNVLSAVVKDQRLEGAEVTLQKNGAASVSASTTAEGVATVTPAFADGDDGVLLIVKKPGYSTLVARCPCKGMTYALSPVMRSLDGLRVVLSWGRSPADLDLHAVFPGNHVFFNAKTGRDANLDVDDTTSWGPETITIEKKAFGQAYLFAVHDYTNRETGSRAALSESGARVFVYVGQSLIRRYEVPRGVGTLWTVFAVDGLGELHDVNELSKAPLDPTGELLERLNRHGDARVAVQSAVAPTDDAATLNAEGERAYHDGRLEESVELYRRAIELAPTYAQAWSNLGLSYRKLGRDSEALWANRQSIAFASGPDANVVRASSYYNIARLYEAGGQFADALVQYEQANRERPLKVYADAKRRMAMKLGQ